MRRSPSIAKPDPNHAHSPSKQHCTGKHARRPRTIALPVAPGKPPPLRHSRASKWRALSLILVHVAMIAHFIHWRVAGKTLTPVEPSEAMYTFREGHLNAGLIFFTVAILSTIVLGRFFCGWGCHIVALQDLSGWILRKLRIRPRQFRSRYMILIPLAAAIYMFILPMLDRVYTRWVLQKSPPPIEPHLMTTGFWDTFAGPLVAIPFLLVCGIVIVYFLGDKAFCAYACPYGAFFGLADKVAAGRIRVTDACEGCGRCSAVCTSNVHVAEEVRRFGMVVDPGCMKCMDCVTVCPNDALYFGFGPLPISACSANGAKESSPRRPGLLSHLPGAMRQAALATLLTLALLVVMNVRDYLDKRTVIVQQQRQLEESTPAHLLMPMNAKLNRLQGAFTTFTGVIAVGVFCVLMLAGLTHNRPKPRFDLSTGGELTALIVFSVYFLAWRGVFGGVVPFLFALGIACVGTYLTLQAARLLARPSVVMQRWPLKIEGRLRPAGFAFVGFVVLLCAATTHAALWQWHDLRSAAWYQESRRVDSPGRRDAAAAALPHLEWCRRWGWGPVEKNLMSLAWAYLALGRPQDAQATATAAVTTLGDDPRSPGIWLEYAKLCTWFNDDDAARHGYRRAIELERIERERLSAKVPDARHPASSLVWREWGLYLAQRVLPGLRKANEDGRRDAEIRRTESDVGVAFENAARFDPRSAEAQILWGDYCLIVGRVDDARRAFIAAALADPTDPEATARLAGVAELPQDFAAAAKEYENALRSNPDIDLFRRCAQIATQSASPR